MTLPTPDRAALAVLPTNTPTSPTPPLAVAMEPRPSDTPSPTPTITPTATPSSTPSPTPTASPTATPTATPGPIVRALGFDDGVIGRLDAEGYTIAERQATGKAGDRVVALIVNPPEQADTELGVLVPRLLIYRVPRGAPAQLIFKDEGSDQTIQFAGLGLTWEEPLGWSDVNADGLLELPVWADNGGFCFACTRVYILQLAPSDDSESPAADGGWQVRELTGAWPALNLLQTPIIPKWLTDYNKDGAVEYEALDGSFESAFGLFREYSPRLYRPFSWDGSGYVDTSRWNPSYFDGQIQRATEAVQATYGQPLPSQDIIGKTLSVLMAYDASGRREEGWAAFSQLSDPVNWTGEAAPGLLNLLSLIRQHLQGQFERGETFAPWPPTVPVLSVSSNTDDSGSPTPVSSSPITNTAAPPQPEPPVAPPAEPSPTPAP